MTGMAVVDHGVCQSLQARSSLLRTYVRSRPSESSRSEEAIIAIKGQLPLSEFPIAVESTGFGVKARFPPVMDFSHIPETKCDEIAGI